MNWKFWKRTDSSRQDARYLTYPASSSTTAKAYDYIPPMIQFKYYFYRAPEHREIVVFNSPVAKFLCYDMPNLALKDFFKFEDSDGKEILQPKLWFLKEAGLRETLIEALRYERTHGWALLVFFAAEVPRFDQRIDMTLAEPPSSAEYLACRAFSPLDIEVFEYDSTGRPSKFRITVKNIGVEGNTRSFVVSAKRTVLVCTRPKDQTHEGMGVLEPIWDDIIALKWSIQNMSAYMAREGSGFMHVTHKDARNAADIQAKATAMRGLSSSKGVHTNDQVQIDYKGSGVTHSVNFPGNIEVLLDSIAMGAGVPKDILKGIQSGRVTGGEVNEKGVYAALNELQVDLIPIIRKTVSMFFPNLKNKHYQVSFLLTFRMTEKDRAEVRLLEAQAKSIELEWKSENEIRKAEALPGVEGGDEVVKKPVPLLPAPNFNVQKEKEEEKEDTAPPSDDDKCVSERIKCLKSHHPDMPQKQVVAAAYSYCKGKDFRADISETDFSKFGENSHELIVPVVLAKEMITLYGERSEFKRFEELVKAFKYAPAVPITIGHPERVEAPALEDMVGVVKNIKPDHKARSIKGDAHFFKDRLPEEYGSEIKKGRKIAGSIGFNVGNFGDSGTFRGRYYDAEQKDLRVYHYAISLKNDGRCSVADGCGLNQA